MTALTLNEEAPCVTCEGEGVIDCDDDRRAESCMDPGCLKHLHQCGNCGGSGLAKDQWYGPDIEAPIYRIPRRPGWEL